MKILPLNESELRFSGLNIHCRTAAGAVKRVFVVEKDLVVQKDLISAKKAMELHAETSLLQCPTTCCLEKGPVSVFRAVLFSAQQKPC